LLFLLPSYIFKLWLLLPAVRWLLLPTMHFIDNALIDAGVCPSKRRAPQSASLLPLFPEAHSRPQRVPAR
jgi:hypothetical protein